MFLEFNDFDFPLHGTTNAAGEIYVCMETEIAQCSTCLINCITFFLIGCNQSNYETSRLLSILKAIPNKFHVFCSLPASPKLGVGVDPLFFNDVTDPIKWQFTFTMQLHILCK